MTFPRMSVFMEHLFYVPGSVLGQENAAINRADVVLILLGRMIQWRYWNSCIRMNVSSNEHPGHPFTIILVFALIISYQSLEEEMDGVGVPGFRRLHSIPF